MKNRKKMRIKKLKKSHIWPSVLFLLLSAIIMLVVLVSIVAFTISYVSDSKFNACYEDAKRITDIVSERIKNDGDKPSFLEKSERLKEYSDAVYLVDEANQIIEGYGEFTCDVSESAEVHLMERYNIYMDKNLEAEVIDAEGKLQLDPMEVLDKALSESEFTNDGTNNNELYEFSYWLRLPAEREGYYVLVHCYLTLYSSDFLMVSVLAMGSLLILLFPVLFLFINVISNVLKQRKMTKLLYTDTVTGGKSRFYFEETGNKILRARYNYHKQYAVVDFSLMKYQSFCTYHGVQKGELLLEKIDRTLTRYINKGECCAHIGNASFALLLKYDKTENLVERINHILKVIPQEMHHSGVVFRVGVFYVDQEKKQRRDIDISDLYNYASAAREAVTEENTSGFVVFTKEMLDEQLWEHKVEEMMESALANEEFQVYIQPKYNPVTEVLSGAEALVRWISPTEGFISPGRFIPIFEKNGFIPKLDDYMISHVAALQKKWLDEGKNVVPVSVNVSRAHFAMPDLAKHICELVDRYGTPHHLIEIELTESAFFDDKKVLMDTVHELKELGFEISMDDFGAGYSSLNSLKDLPLDILKLDAEFFRGEDDEERGEIVVAQVIQLAKKLEMKIVAEGIEKKEQVDFLAGQGCDMIQGYYYSKPVPNEEYKEKLEKANTKV